MVELIDKQQTPLYYIKLINGTLNLKTPIFFIIETIEF